MKNTKIVLVTECPYAGVLRAVISNANIFKSLGFDVHLVIPEVDRDRYGEIADRNVLDFQLIGDVHRIPFRKGYVYIRQNKKCLKKFLMTMGRHVVVSYGSYAGKITRSLYQDGASEFVYHVPQCIDIQRMTLRFKLIESIFERFLSKSATGYLACGSSEAYNLAHNYRVPANKIIFCPNFTENVQHEGGKMNRLKYRFIYVGRIVKSKGLHSVLEALERIGALNEIVVVGEGPDKSDLEKNYSSATFVGNVPNAEVFQYLSSASFIVSNSLIEGLPFSILEAMSMGVVPILSAVDGHEDLISDAYNGFLFRNERELTNLLFKTNFISDKRYDFLSGNARRVSKNCYNITRKNLEQHFKRYD